VKANTRVAEVMISVAKLSNLKPTSEKDFRSVFNWFWYERPLAKASGSADFLLHPEDFVSLTQRSQEGQSFEDLVVWLFEWGPAWARKVDVPQD
jgi:hypothetical protein